MRKQFNQHHPINQYIFIMKKFIYSLFTFGFLASTVSANIVAPGTAQSVAENFYKQTTHAQTVNSVLAYTEKSSAGDALYYAYNVNGKEGFVIISAEDAGYPIVVYSTEGIFV